MMIYFYFRLVQQIVIFLNLIALMAFSFNLETKNYMKKRREDRMSEPGNSFSSERILVTVISVGSVICLVTMLAIVREMYHSCRSSSDKIHVQVTEDVYAAIGDVEKSLT